MNKKEFWGNFVNEGEVEGHSVSQFYDNEPEKVWQWIEEYAIQMCKEQREICANTYDRDDSHYENFENILYAPLPKELIK